MIFQLTPEQKKLFTKLKLAYKACEKANILFVNNYGTLEAYDKAIVESYEGDETDVENMVSSHDSSCLNTMETDVSWSDDEHFIVLTPKGMKLILRGDEDED